MQWGAAPYNLSLQRKHLVYNLFCCLECKGDFGSESFLDKHKNKYDLYDKIFEDFADIPFKLSDKSGQNTKDRDGEEDREHENDSKKEFDLKEEISH